ncbi:beta-N-acetylhexosaminidase [Paenibacillus algorifonticola]|uniref:beta-N-acetylhexosaminidase n=1 Tax=Paenibacillus algorifonticola TaxID=684063 RepID=A0A1I2A736_9BACL|nr:beta-N-acetylhexosaminidase [Paenibacillus algorifonticola]SFE39732.1 beta-N-acetylhexosaminidase [Paenibacillus algorifonticola]
MLKKITSLLLASFLVICASSCGSAGDRANSSNGSHSSSNQPSTAMPRGPSATESAAASAIPTASPTPTATEAPDPIKQEIASMSVDEKIGQLVLVGLEGTTLQEDAIEMMNTYHVGGFILYKRNITDASQTLALLNELKKQNKKNPVPLWLSIDQEGGTVSRMPQDFVKIPSAQSIGSKNKPQYAYGIGEAIGAELYALGFNMDFAPVLDINSNPDNPVIGNRAFGSTAESVIASGIETMKGIQAGHVVPVIKHFPGHGDTSVDSHLDLPVVDKSLKQLEQFELLPFVEAIKERAPAVMVGHLLIPAMDKQYPASLSKTIITDLLRDELGFTGVVITDDMTMGGITKHFGIQDAAVKAVQAGNDILLVGHDAKQQIAVLKALKKAVKAGEISMQALDDSVYRIIRLKSTFKLKDELISRANVDAVNRQIKKALNASK